MIRLVYNLIFTLLFLVTWPYFFNRMRRRGRVWRKMGERLAIFERGALRTLQSFRDPVWIHAVSVGEMKMTLSLVAEIRRLRPQQDVIITTTTVTGRDLGEAARDRHTHVLYHPIDLLPVVRRAYEVFRPALLVLVDQELWPNHIWEARKRGVPVWIVNARMSDRSMARFRRFRGLLRKVLCHLELICVQMEADVPRFRRAGFPAHKLFVTGSLKFGVTGEGASSGLVSSLRSKLGWDASTPVLLGGSTHPGEEKILLECHQKWRERFPDLKLVLVPRHVERAAEVGRLIDGYGCRWTLRSRIEAAPPGTDVLLVDTTGELAALYPWGSVIFVGKSLTGKGGQNFIEAAAAGRPVVLGPHMQNFRDLHRLFTERDAVITVDNAGQFDEACGRLLADPAAAARLGRRARAVVEENTDTPQRIAAMIDRRLNGPLAACPNQREGEGVKHL